jgi:hypothetical protein
MNKLSVLIVLVVVTVMGGAFFYNNMNDSDGAPDTELEMQQEKADGSNKPGEAKRGSSNLPPKGDTRHEEGVNGLPTNRQVIIEGNPSVSNDAQAQDVVNQQSAHTGLPEAGSLEVAGHTEDEYGNTYYQIQQYYKGIPVYGANALLDVVQGNAEELYGSWQSEINLEVNATYQPTEALTMAAQERGGTGVIVASIVNTPRLVVFVSTLKPHLAWEMTAVVFEGGEIEMLIIDAHSPSILLSSAIRKHM